MWHSDTLQHQRTSDKSLTSMHHGKPALHSRSCGRPYYNVCPTCPEYLCLIGLHFLWHPQSDWTVTQRWPSTRQAFSQVTSEFPRAVTTCWDHVGKTQKHNKQLLWFKWKRVTGKALDKQHLNPGTNTGGGIPYFLSYIHILVKQSMLGLENLSCA